MKPARLAASSLVEITVASVLLVLTFTLALTVCARLVREGPNARQLRAQQLVAHLAATTRRTQAWVDQTTQVGPLLLERTLTRYRGKPHLLRLTIRALEQEQVLAHYDEVLYVPPTPAH